MASQLNDVIDNLVVSVIGNASDQNAPVRKTIIDESVKSLKVQRIERCRDVTTNVAASLEANQNPAVQKALESILKSIAELADS